MAPVGLWEGLGVGALVGAGVGVLVGNGEGDWVGDEEGASVVITQYSRVEFEEPAPLLLSLVSNIPVPYIRQAVSLLFSW
jgi:hypothetical protein